MLRKLILACAATVALGAAAFTPSAASAHGWYGGHGGWHGGGFYRGWGGPRFYGRPVYFGGGYGLLREAPGSHAMGLSLPAGEPLLLTGQSLPDLHNQPPEGGWSFCRTPFPAPDRTARKTAQTDMQGHINGAPRQTEGDLSCCANSFLDWPPSPLCPPPR